MYEKPKRTLIAYCVLAERLRTPGVSPIKALSPFFAEACQQFAGKLFDAEEFSDAVAARYGIRIPRLAVLGLAGQLAAEGILIPVSGYANSTVYRYKDTLTIADEASVSPVTEGEVESVLLDFVGYCRSDDRLSSKDDSSLQQALLDRLLNVESMRILGRKEASITAKKSATTLVLDKSSKTQTQSDRDEIHLDFLVSQFLLDLRDKNATAFERVSNVAFANMAAEAIACFRDPPTVGESLSTLTVYLDSPLLLDMLGVNTEYSEYGQELLLAIRASGAKAAIFDHCVNEAEAAVHSQLTYLRSGINKISSGWGTTAIPDLLSALVGNIGDRAEERLGIAVHRDPEVNLHRRSQSAVGDIEEAMARRMQAWGNVEAKDYDRKSVWAMLAIRQTNEPRTRICDSEWLLLTRNTPLVTIANDAWATWLKETTKFSKMHIARWVPVAMSDKQFAGYLWARTGGCGGGAISTARLLSYCSAAVRPRADVKARAYNLVLELNGQEGADDVAALLEDREAVRALMFAAKGDPEDVTQARLPFLIEKMKLAAGEFAAAKVRAESEQQLAEERRAHDREMAQVQSDAMSAQDGLNKQHQEAERALLQVQQDRLQLERQNIALQAALDAQSESERDRRRRVLMAGFKSGRFLYRACRWMVAILFGIATFCVAQLSAANPGTAAFLSALLTFGGFWFVPELFHKPLDWCAMKRLHSVVARKEAGLEVPGQAPDFRRGVWDIDN